MDKQIFIDVLKKELVPALGCTEPIAIAYASAKARDVLGTFPDKVEISCSGNIIKNVKGVTVPNSGGMIGIGAAAVLGVVGGNSNRELEVLEEVCSEDIEKTKELLEQNYFFCTLKEDVENLYVAATVHAGEHWARVTIINRHTKITEIVKDGVTIFEEALAEHIQKTDWSDWSVKEIIQFADEVEIDCVAPILERQMQCNMDIANAGLKADYGARVGKTLLDAYGKDIHIRAKAYAAAGSDARMNGCALPVIINSGSGNQGMTVSLPVMLYAEELGVSREKCLRALLISNLISIYQKHYIGSLSSFCGAVTAAAGSGAAITYLHGGSYDAICRTIVNTLANVGGIVCDGAKSSCAAKIAASVDAAILGHHLSMKGLVFKDGEGLVKEDIEDTIRQIGYMGRVGMKETDIAILNLMLDNVRKEDLNTAN